MGAYLYLADESLSRGVTGGIINPTAAWARAASPRSPACCEQGVGSREYTRRTALASGEAPMRGVPRMLGWNDCVPDPFPESGDA